MIDPAPSLHLRPPRCAQVFLLVSLLLGLRIDIAKAEPSSATDEAPSRYRIDLMTMGPGDALPTRAGHAALVVCEILPDDRELTTVYNYGDADFDAPGLELAFALGTMRSFLSVTGDVYDATELYGPMQDRDVWRQRLALGDDQARIVAERLEQQAKPDNREYDFHYLDATCTTGIRDLLDEVMEGELRAQLATRREPWTIRDYQQFILDDTIFAALLADVGFGRRHDRAIDQYDALLIPWKMREYLPQVTVPDPAGTDARVPLASKPEMLAKRGGPPPLGRRNPITWIVATGGILLVGLGAVFLRRRGALPSRLAGLWLLAWSLPIGALGAVLATVALASSIPELRNNELLLSLLATDLVLLGPAIAWLRGRTRIPYWLRAYATLRLVVVGLAVLARAAGLFVQQPWILPLASLLCGASLWWLLRSAHSGLSETQAPT